MNITSNNTSNGAMIPSDPDLLTVKIDRVYEIFDTTFSNYKLNNIFLSFNGGKDCTVLLDLLESYMKARSGYANKTVKVIYIQPNQPFIEIENFVGVCEETYNLTIETRKGKLKTVLIEFCKEISARSDETPAVLMGCRRTDPYCENLDFMQLTDPDWPKLMRVNPLLDWTCKDIWEYILNNKIKYCTLYDNGYTSIGDCTNTIPNPHLRIDENTYHPAYKLEDDKLERAGRT